MRSMWYEKWGVGICRTHHYCVTPLLLFPRPLFNSRVLDFKNQKSFDSHVYVLRILTAFQFFTQGKNMHFFRLFYFLQCPLLRRLLSKFYYSTYLTFRWSQELELENAGRHKVRQLSCLTTSHLPAVAQPNILCFWDFCSPRNFILDFLPFTNF